MINGKSILITGGTGSFGNKFIDTCLNESPGAHRIVVFSRDELKQYEMSQKYPHKEYPNLRFFIGDIRDRDRIKRALEGIDIVIHAAALKQVPTAEYNPFECINTNVLGAENLIQAALDSSVKKVIALSTDKAAAPINLYGASKLCSDKLFIAANNMAGKKDISFSIVRYGNVMGSRGSVVPFFLSSQKKGVLPITDPAMTRFSLMLGESVKIVEYAIKNSLGGEIFVPKIPSYNIMDLAEAISPESLKPIIGIRAGEKLHEEMITKSDGIKTIENNRYYIIVPDLCGENSPKFNDYITNYNAKQVKDGFSYSSDENTNFLTVKEIQSLLKQM